MADMSKAVLFPYQLGCRNNYCFFLLKLQLGLEGKEFLTINGFLNISVRPVESPCQPAPQGSAHDSRRTRVTSPYTCSLLPLQGLL